MEGWRVHWPHGMSLKSELWLYSPVLLATGAEPTPFGAESGAVGRVRLLEVSDPTYHSESFLPTFSWMSGDCCMQGRSSFLHQLSGIHRR